MLRNVHSPEFLMSSSCLPFYQVHWRTRDISTLNLFFLLPPWVARACLSATLPT